MESVLRLKIPISIENTSLNQVRNIFYEAVEFHIILQYFCRGISKLFSFLRKNEVLNICRYLKSFYTYTKINNIFLKFDYYLLRMQKIVEIGWIFHSEKRESKT